MKNRQISIADEDELWSLAKNVCEQAKLDTAHEKNLFTELVTSLAEKWLRISQQLTQLEKDEWKETTYSELSKLAERIRAPWWRRVLFYQRNRYLRYLIILVSGASVAFLCQDYAIAPLFTDSANSLIGWFWFSSFGVLVGSPAILAFTARTKGWLVGKGVRETMGGILLLGLIGRPVLSLDLLIWQLHQHSIVEFDWLMFLLSVPISFCGCIAIWTEIFAHPQVPASFQSTSDALQEGQGNDQAFDGTVADEKLLKKAIDVCSAAQMDDDTFRDDSIKEIYGTLSVWRDEFLENNISREVAVQNALSKFGGTSGAANEDFRWFRVLFYKRHRVTRYVAIVGLGLAAVYVRLLTAIHSVNVAGGGTVTRFSDWGGNILYSSALGLCVLVATRVAGTRGWPLKYLLALPMSWEFFQISLQMVVALENIDRNWSHIGRTAGFFLLTPVLMVVSILLLSCTFCEFAAPFSHRSLARIRRIAKKGSRIVRSY